MKTPKDQDFAAVRNAEPFDGDLVRLPLLILDDQVLFPDVLSLVPLTTEAQLAALQGAMERGGTLIAIKRKASDNGRQLLDSLHEVGTEIAPGPISDAPGSQPKVMVEGRRRLRILDVSDEARYPMAKARILPERETAAEQVEPLSSALIELFKRSSQYIESMPEDVVKYVLSVQDPRPALRFAGRHHAHRAGAAARHSGARRCRRPPGIIGCRPVH